MRRLEIIVRQQRIVIVGAGIVGLSTAYALLSQGVQHVTVLEQETVDHSRGTSHGLSRLLRFEYGADSLYSEMVRLSLHRWRSLERAAKRTLYTRTGLLVLGTETDNFTQPSYTHLRRMHLPTERLSSQHCQQRFPQFATHSYSMLTYNSEAGILHASTCLQTLKALISDLGGTIQESCRVTRIASESQLRPIRLFCSSGNELSADRVVLATGPWVHRLLAELHLSVRLTRQYLLYFANLPVSSFGVNSFPAFMTNDLYGLPMHSTGNNSGPSWLKAASHTFGPTVEPDEVPRTDERFIAQVTRKLCDLLPALRQAKLAHIDACMYDVSPDEDFIIDRLPTDPRVIFATGLTGHGFKFGPLLGELLSSMVRDIEPLVPLERFRLARFSPQWQRQQEISVA